MTQQNIQVTTDIAIFSHFQNELSILLVSRKNEPFQGKWCLPGGFIENDEDLEEAARRELKEETGLTVEVLDQLQAFGTPGRDPRGRTITILYYTVFVDNEPVAKAGDDASDARWFRINELPELCFDHAQIISTVTAQVLREL